MIDVDIRGSLGNFELSVQFQAGAGITALFGKSGAGKSSLIRMISGLNKPIDGHIQVGDTLVFNAAQQVNLSVQARRVGIVFQDARLFPHMSVERNLLYSRWAGGRRSDIALTDITELLGISHLLRRRPHGLSGGEKQRVAIGRALLSDPKLLILDEPLASLDVARKAEILPYLQRLKRELGLPMLYVSHMLGEIEELADTLVLLERGYVVAHGPIAQMLSNLELPQLAMGPEAGALLFAECKHYDEEWQLTEFALEGQRLILPGDVGAPHQVSRIRIKAKDVALARKRPEASSVRNVLEVEVLAISSSSGPYAEVECRLGEQRLRARLTRKAVQDLDLTSGQIVFALVKSVALDQ